MTKPATPPAVPVVSGGPGTPVPRRSPAARVAPAVLGLAAVAVLLVLRQLFSHLMPAAWMVDFTVYYEGGRTALDGGSLYDLSVDTSLFPGLPFTYPPFAALVLAPLSLLGRTAASAVWLVANVLCLAGLVWLTLGMVRVGPPRRRAWLTAVWTIGAVVLDPVLLNLMVGQINIVIALLVLLDLSRTLPDRWRGYAVGISAGVKLIPLIYVAYLLCTRRWAIGVRAGLTFLGTVAIGFAVLPRDSVRYWLDGVFVESGRTLHSIVVNQSLSGMFARVAGTDVAPAWTLAVTAVVGVLGLAVAVWAHRQGQEFVGILAVACTGLIVSPITWAMHGIWVVPALVWLTFTPWRSARVLPRMVAVLVAAFFVLPSYEWAQGMDRYQNTVAGNLIATFGGLLFPAVLVVASIPLWLRHLRSQEPVTDAVAA
jgi:alpha-1,2-mannosyltransferase